MSTTIDKLKAYYSNYGLNPKIRSIGPDVQKAITGLEKEKVVPASFKLEDLLKYPNPLDLSTALAYLPPDVQMSELDRDALLWVYMHSNYGVKRSLAGTLYEVDGLDPDFLERADNTARNLARDQNITTILKNYDLLNCICEAINQSIDLPALLKLYAKKDVSISEKRIKDYRLELIFPKRNDSYGSEEFWGHYKINEKTFYIYLDTPIGIALVYKDEPNAIIGFFAKDEKTFFIQQIQGVMPHKGDAHEKAHSRGLVVLEWEKLLINIAERVAKTLGFKAIVIQGGKNNKWSSDLIRDRDLKRYDKPAEEQGYTQGVDGNWSKDLTGNKLKTNPSIFEHIKYRVKHAVVSFLDGLKEIKEILFD